MPETPHVKLSGSERAPLPGARQVGPVDPNERVEVTVLLRPREAVDQAAEGAPRPGHSRPSEPGRARPLTRRELALRRGASDVDVDAVRTFAAERGLSVRDVKIGRRSLTLVGTAAQMSAAFHVELSRWERDSTTYRGRTGPIHVPAELEPRIVAILGLDDRPQSRTHFRRLPREGTPGERSPAAAAGSGPPSRMPERRKAVPAAAPRVWYTPPQVAALYAFPPGDGSGQTIAIIELGGGFQPSDLTAYFGRLGLPEPSVEMISIDGGSNAPTGSPDGPDAEVCLDIEVAGAIAPKASIAVYFAPNTDRGFLDAITAAVHDTKRTPSIISISWGAPEAGWTSQAMTAFDQAFADAGLVGVSVFASAGDNGSTDGETDGRQHVDFPASSPNVTACGGTSLTADSVDTSIVHETVWNDGAGGGATGGGVSATFPLPAWQSAAGVPPSANPGGGTGRGVPDVAGDADPLTGYDVEIDGQHSVVGGTSAVSPLWAGLVARLNQSLARPVGFLNPSVYSAGEAVFRDITSGSNGAYKAGAGWDACTGVGSPNGEALLEVLRRGAGQAPPE